MPMLETDLSHRLTLEDDHLVAGILNPSVHTLMDLAEEEKKALLMKYCQVLGLLSTTPQLVAVRPQGNTNKAASGAGIVSQIMSRLLEKPTS